MKMMEVHNKIIFYLKKIERATLMPKWEFKFELNSDGIRDTGTWVPARELHTWPRPRYKNTILTGLLTILVQLQVPHYMHNLLHLFIILSSISKSWHDKSLLSCMHFAGLDLCANFDRSLRKTACWCHCQIEVEVVLHTVEILLF